MGAAQDERCSKAACGRRWRVEWHLGHGQGLEATPQLFEFHMVDAGSNAPGIPQAPTAGDRDIGASVDRACNWPVAAR
jgi:hypothetical protein